MHLNSADEGGHGPRTQNITPIAMINESTSTGDETETKMDAIEASSRSSSPRRTHGSGDLEKAKVDAVSSEPLRRTITAQDWNGPDDPENPLNW